MTIGRFKVVVWFKERSEDDMFRMFEEMSEKYQWSFYHIAHEIAPTTGNHHIDGYYEYPTQRKLPTELKKFNKMFGNGFGDLQVARGTAGENCDYTEKEGRRQHKHGEPGKGQGSREDLKDLAKEISTGKRTVDQITQEDPDKYHQYGRTMMKLEDIALRKKFRMEQPVVEWLCGPTGIGKSHWLFKDYDPETMYLWKDDNGWQDGYSGQTTILINEFRGEIPFPQLLQILDKWPYALRRRNREPAPLLATRFKITSAKPPEELYMIAGEDINQLTRRVTVTIAEDESDIPN